MKKPWSLVENSADPEQVREAAQKEKLGLDREREDLRAILDTVHGRRFVWKWLNTCGVFQSSMVPGQPDLTAFKEGVRNVGLKMLLEVNEANPNAYVVMMNEAKEEEARHG